MENLPSQFYINDFFINIETGEVVLDNQSKVIEPKVMALLKVLAQHPQKVLTAESLFELVWPQAIYSPNSVRRNITLLRQALSDVDKKIIKTHPKRGYSLDAEIRLPQSNETTTTAKANPQKGIKTVFMLAILSILAMVMISVFSAHKPVSLTRLQPITASNEQERYMQISPGGRFMAYIQNTKKANKRMLRIKDLVTNSSWPLKDELKEYTYLAWDSGISALVYSSKDNNSITFSRLHLDAKMSVVNEEPLFTRTDITWNSVFFIDEQQHLYYLANQNSSEHSRNVSLYRYQLETGQLEKLLEPSRHFKPYKLSLSPNQSELAIAGFDKQGVTEVKLLQLKSLELVSLGKIDSNWHFLTWFNNGEALLLSNGNELKQLKINGELSTLNYKSYDFLVYPQIVNDKLYFIEAKSDQDILIHNIGSFTEPKPLVDSNTVDSLAALSPDEKTVAYMSLRNGFPQLFIKQLDTGNEQLIFANVNHELALSKPVWHKSATQIASSINNKPFVIKLQEDKSSIEWLTSILGRPLDWYNHSEALLIVDKASHNDELIKFNIETKETHYLQTKLARRPFFLSTEDELLAIDKGQVTYQPSGKTLFKAQSTISKVIPDSGGFYYQFTQNEKMIMNYYDFELGNSTLSEEFNLLCVEFCNQITAISGSVVLLRSNTSTADILSLTVE